jgi:hypothetical protein
MSPSNLPIQTTGEDGRFSFGVPKGKYSLIVDWRGLPQGYLQRPFGAGSAIFTGPGQDTSQLVFRYRRPGAIVGRLLDERDEPVERAMIQVIASDLVMGERRVRTVGWVYTNDRGEFRYGPALPTSYYLLTTAEPPREAQVSAPPQPDPGLPVRAIAPTYYPGTTDPDGSGRIDVISGQETRADFRIVSSLGQTVSFSCPECGKDWGVVSLTKPGMKGLVSYERQASLWPQGGKLNAVPSGRYLLKMVSHIPGQYYASQEITVATSDVAVQLTPQPQPSVSGTVVLAPGARGSVRNLVVNLADEATGVFRNGARTKSDGTFKIPMVDAVRYRIRLAPTSGLFPVEITADGQYADDVLDMTNAAPVQVRIVASDATGSVKGRVLDGDHPVAGVMVALGPVKASKDPTAYRGFQTDSDGSFDIIGLQAGDYQILAVSDRAFEYANPRVMSRAASVATIVHVEAHQATTQDLTVVTPPR